MQRKQALVVAATVAFLGASGIVAAAAVTGANILGFHVSSPFKTASANGTTTSTDATEPPTTPAPVYVVTTELYDEFIVVPTAAQPAPAAAPQAAAPYSPQAPAEQSYDPPADPTPAQTAAPATAAPTAPTAPTTTPQAVTTVTTAAPAAATTTTTRATTTTTKAPSPTTTLFDPSGPLPAGFSVPSNLKVAASQTALPPGGPFKKCQFEDNHTWNCEK